MASTVPTIEEIRALGERLREWLCVTPVLRCRSLEQRLGVRGEIHAKLEFLQRTGTFKPRGALSTMLSLDAAQLEAGVTAVSAGNHAIATAFAASALGTSAKVVMIRTASPARVAACRQHRAEIVFADDVHVAFEMVERVREEEGRYLVHPFEGPQIAAGTGTVGLEMIEQMPDLDAIIVPIGGGGLCGGISHAVKRLRPDCAVYGVEPSGADSMHRSFRSGKPERIDKVRTIADSLGAPFAAPYSFELCRANVDELVMIEDDEIKAAMGTLFADLKVAVEPACAASTAALAGPLRERLDGQKVGLVLCGSNVDWQTFERHVVFV